MTYYRSITWQYNDFLQIDNTSLCLENTIDAYLWNNYRTKYRSSWINTIDAYLCNIYRTKYRSNWISTCRMKLLNGKYTLIGTHGRMKLIPDSAIWMPTISAICWSNPRSKIDLTITETSRPRPRKKPAHSRETYEAPIANVLPGQYGKENKSSLKHTTGYQTVNIALRSLNFCHHKLHFY